MTKPGLAAYQELLSLQEQRDSMLDDLDAYDQEIADLQQGRDKLAERVDALPARAESLHDRIVDRVGAIVAGFKS